MSPRFLLGRKNVPCVAEVVNRSLNVPCVAVVVNRSLKADCTDFTGSLEHLHWPYSMRTNLTIEKRSFYYEAY